MDSDLGADVDFVLPESNQAMGAVERTMYDVMYEVVGDAPRAMLTWRDGQGATWQGERPLPFRASESLSQNGYAYVFAQNVIGHGRIVARILLNGRLWKETAAEGAYKIASCSGFVGNDLL